MEPFNRYQIERAICAFFKPDARTSRSELLDRIKRLLDIDRSLRRSRRSKVPAWANFAFSSGEPSGKNMEASFTAYEAFALLVATNLLEHGFSQNKCVEILRRIRPPLEVEHALITTPSQMISANQKSNALQDRAGVHTEPIFVGISSAHDPAPNLPIRAGTNVVICRGENAVTAFVKVRELGSMSTIVEITDTAIRFQAQLLEVAAIQDDQTVVNAR